MPLGSLLFYTVCTGTPFSMFLTQLILLPIWISKAMTMTMVPCIIFYSCACTVLERNGLQKWTCPDPHHCLWVRHGFNDPLVKPCFIGKFLSSLCALTSHLGRTFNLLFLLIALYPYMYNSLPAAPFSFSYVLVQLNSLVLYFSLLSSF